MTVRRSSLFLGRILRRPSGALAAAILLAVFLMAILASVIAPQGPWVLGGDVRLWPGQNPAFPLGTDNFGRDLLAGVLYGARVSLMVGIGAASIAASVGVVVGAVAGYYGGVLDDILMRLTDAVQTIPSFLAAIAIVGVVEPSLTSIIAAVAIVEWPMIARLVRSEVLKIKGQDFVAACRIGGTSDLSIIFRQVLPNCMSPVIVATSLIVGTAILTEAGLAFLGLGDPNAMSWGTIIGSGRSTIRSAWYIVAVPSFAILFTVLALNLMSDALNDALNPRLNQS